MGKIKNITFDSFNWRRDMRGADAANFVIDYSIGGYRNIWMSEKDIKKNIKIFPEFKAELQKGLDAYGVN